VLQYRNNGVATEKWSVVDELLFVLGKDLFQGGLSYKARKALALFLIAIDRGQRFFWNTAHAQVTTLFQALLFQ
jgi:hypothetical protein